MATKNSSLHNAKVQKNDEFYTQYEDIEAEMNAYIEWNKDVFRGKTILCPCDDPEWSNFTKYFAANFELLGIKKLISTSYAKSSGNHQISLFELNSPDFDKEKHDTHGRVFVLDEDMNRSGKIDIEDIKFQYLEGDGDFRSEEVTKLRDEADIIITNPPWSLFREYIEWVLKGNKLFVAIGNQNAITYKEIFPLIKDNKIWLGHNEGGFRKGNSMFFFVPDDYENKYVEEHKGRHIMQTTGKWFTNIDHGKRHEAMPLMTMEDNLRYNKKLRNKLMKDYGKLEYPHYDNYDAIEVPITECIPKDYVPCWYNCDKAEECPYAQKEGMNNNAVALCEQACNGCMGVPITYIDKHNPDENEIIKFRKGNDEKDLTYVAICGDALNGTERNGTERNGTERRITPYFRIIIRRKKM